MSTMIYFDTLHYAQTLKEAGFSEKQAETLVKVQQKSLSECLDTTLATKADIQEIRAATKEDIQEIRTATKADIQEVRTEVQEVKMELRILESKVNAHSWMLGFLVAGMSALIIKAFF